VAGTSSIARPRGGVACRLQYAVFLLGGDIATVCDTDEALRRLRGGAEAPWHVPDRMQVRFMNQAATIPRLAQDSVLGKDAGVPREALP
jgi:hypothetical protein